MIADITHEQWHQLAAAFEFHGCDSHLNFLSTFFPEPDWNNIPNQDGKLPREPDENGISRFPGGNKDERWYYWRKQHWGTRHDVYDCINCWEQEQPSSEFRVRFCTAWSPLSSECMAMLSKHFPGAILTNFYEEEGNDFCGFTIAKDGVIRDFCESMSKYRQPFLRKKFTDLDARLAEEEQELDEFFCDICEFSEFSDFIRDAQESRIKEMIQQVDAETQEIHPCISGSGI